MVEKPPIFVLEHVSGWNEHLTTFIFSSMYKQACFIDMMLGLRAPLVAEKCKEACCWWTKPLCITCWLTVPHPIDFQNSYRWINRGVFFFGKSRSSGNILQYAAGAWRHIFWVTLKEVAWSMIGSKGFKEGLSFLIQQELGLGMVLERFRKYAFFSSRKLHMDSDLGHHDNPPSKQSVAYSSSYCYSREMLLLTAATLLLWSYGG